MTNAAASRIVAREVPFLELMASEQQLILRMCRVIARGVMVQRMLPPPIAPPGPAPTASSKASHKSLVCCVVSTDVEIHPIKWTMGLNYELHTLTQCTNGRSSHLELNSTPPLLLKGLLKGCAEQNALGSFASQGHAYHSISQMFLASSSSRQDAACRCTDCDETPRPVLMPCPECWGHMCSLATHRAAESAALSLGVVINPLDLLQRFSSQHSHYHNHENHFQTASMHDETQLDAFSKEEAALRLHSSSHPTARSIHWNAASLWKQASSRSLTPPTIRFIV